MPRTYRKLLKGEHGGEDVKRDKMEDKKRDLGLNFEA